MPTLRTLTSVDGWCQNKRVGTTLVERLYADTWRQHHPFVQVWNAAPKARRYYERLGFEARGQQAQGELWFRPTKTSAWPACVREDTGAGPRSLKKRTEELAVQVERAKRDRARADEARMKRSSGILEAFRSALGDSGDSGDSGGRGHRGDRGGRGDSGGRGGSKGHKGRAGSNVQSQLSSTSQKARKAKKGRDKETGEEEAEEAEEAEEVQYHFRSEESRMEESDGITGSLSTVIEIHSRLGRKFRGVLTIVSGAREGEEYAGENLI